MMNAFNDKLEFACPVNDLVKGCVTGTVTVGEDTSSSRRGSIDLRACVRTGCSRRSFRTALSIVEHGRVLTEMI